MMAKGSRVVLVTGCGRGQGRHHLTYFAGQGDRVCGFDLFGASDNFKAQYALSGPEEFDATCTALRGVGESTPLIESIDITDFGQLQGFAASVRGAYKNLDLLICNAGLQHIGTVASADESAIDRMVAVNVAGTIKTVKAMVDLFRPDKGGCIVLIGSLTSQRCPESQALYAACKGSLTSLARGLAVELGHRRIRVHALHPSYVLSEEPHALSAVSSIDDTRFYDQYPLAGVNGIPIGNISQVIDFLASDAGAYLNALSLPVDAGKLAMV
ncbi:MAG: SDR family oxidoreductase [Alphaproteobacteria bacterium GM202ARS2]|nr:SDR family oxidoreductase [Alphaproteobacteria bacterium GM202ARS2]